MGVVLGVDRAHQRAVAAVDQVVDQALAPHDADVAGGVGVALEGGGVGEEDDAAARVHLLNHQVVPGPFVDVAFLEPRHE